MLVNAGSIWSEALTGMNAFVPPAAAMASSVAPWLALTLTPMT